MKKENVWCFDFDGTITYKDTLLEFIKYAKGRKAFLCGFLLHSPLLLLMKLGLYPNGKAKQRIFRYFFKGMHITDFNRLCLDFASDSPHLLRQSAIAYMKEKARQEAPTYVVSASIANWVCPFFETQGLHEVKFLCTEIEVEGGIVTGRFKTKNCTGKEKVDRIRQALGIMPSGSNRPAFHITAFGDSSGDKQMFSFADEWHYKPFAKQ